MPVQKLLSLPHSFSSPEFPVPSIETSILNSTPLVTLHTSPLISPNSRTSNVTNIMFSVPTIRSSYLDANVKQPDDFNSCSQNKKYGRSHSEMILPGIERSGELIDSSKPPPNNPWLKYFFSLSLHERTPKILTSTGQIKVEKRFHSLLLYISKCFCYNYNISKLILKSKDLPFVEHFNFDIYFVRSLSYKFFNCYLNLQEEADSNCISRNISFDNNYRNFKEILQLNHPNLSFVCLKDRFPIFLEIFLFRVKI